MDEDITSEMEAFVDGGNIVWDEDEIIAFSKATGRDLKLFFEDGWAGNDLEWDMATSLMTYALHVFTGSFPGGQTEWDEELKGPWNEVDFPGMKPDATDTLCSYFGANVDDLKAQTTGTAIPLYTGGWRGERCHRMRCGTSTRLSRRCCWTARPTSSSRTPSPKRAAAATTPVPTRGFVRASPNMAGKRANQKRAEGT